MTTAAKPAIIDRPAAMFGVCEAIGDDFGINANWFRVALVPLILWQPLWTVVGYFCLGALVLATRLIFPDVVAPIASVATIPTVAATSAEPIADELRLAA
ncbi:MAG: PspC domain-containing protein [Sphingomicrobium sp.]